MSQMNKINMAACPVFFECITLSTKLVDLGGNVITILNFE